MKIHLLTFAGIVLFAFGTSAQITPKSYVLGGGFSMAYGGASNSPNGYQQFNLSVSPSIGKFVSEKWLLQGGIGYGLNTQKYGIGGPISNSTAHSFSLSFGATRFIPITDKFYFTLGGFVSPGYTAVKTSYPVGVNPDYEYSISSASVSISPGLTYFINKKWMLYSNFGALRYSMSGRSDSDVVDHNLSMNLNSTSYIIGLRYVFGASK